MSQTHGSRDPTTERADRPPDAFTCDWSADGSGTVWMTPAGELDIATSPTLTAALREPLAQTRLVVLDLERLTFIDSSGVRAIAEATDRARDSGRRVVLVRCAPDVRRLLTLRGAFDEFTDFVDMPSTQPLPQVGREQYNQASPSGAHEIDDEGLLVRLAAGDQDALSTLYDRHAAPAFALAQRMSGGDYAEDVVVQAFVELSREPVEYRAIDTQRRLLDITRRCALAELGDRDRYVGGGPAPRVPEHRADARADSAAGRPVAPASRGDAGLRALPEAQRACVELAYFKGLSVTEIAARRGISPADVNDHLRRGLTGIVSYVKENAPG